MTQDNQVVAARLKYAKRGANRVGTIAGEVTGGLSKGNPKVTMTVIAPTEQVGRSINLHPTTPLGAERIT